MKNVYLLLDGCVWVYLLSGTTHVFILCRHTTDLTACGILAEKHNKRFVGYFTTLLVHGQVIIIQESRNIKSLNFRGTTKQAHGRLALMVCKKYSHRESNPDQRFRKPLIQI